MKKKLVDTGPSETGPVPEEKEDGNQERKAPGGENLEEMITDQPQDSISQTKERDEESERTVIDSEQYPVSTEGRVEGESKEPVIEQPAAKGKTDLALIEMGGSAHENVLADKLLFSGLLKKGGEDKENIFDTPLREIAEFLMRSGIPALHLKEGLLAVIGFIASRLGYPIHLLFTEDEGALGGELLNICRDLSPTEGIVDFLEIPDTSQYPLKGKTIFLPDCPTKDKRLKPLSLLLNNNRAFFQDLVKRGRETGIGNETDGGAAGLVAFVKDMESEILQLPFVTHLHIPFPLVSAAERTVQEERGFRSNSSEFKLGRDYVKALLSRLEPQDVVIPFFDRMAESIHRIETTRFLKNALKVITILNHFEPASIQEIILKFMSHETGERIIRATESSKLPVPIGKMSHRKPLISTHFDFHCLKILANGLISKGREGLTKRQTRVFEALKAINLDYLKNFGLKREEILPALEDPYNVKKWPEIRQIQDKVNQGQEDKIAMGTLVKEIPILLEKGVIQRSRVASNPIRYAYCIRTLVTESAFVELPDPKDFYDPSSSGPIRGRNPLTGKIEVI